MCVETPGVPPLLSASERGPSDRIPPDELNKLGPVTYGRVALPPHLNSAGSTPIVVICHERYGVVQHTLDLAEKMAGTGFLTVAPDFYSDVELTGNEDRLPDISDEAALRHLDAAITYAREIDGAGEDSPVAIVGICRTGSYGLVADAARADVTAVVMLYGGAQEKEYHVNERRERPYAEMVSAGSAPVLGLWGEKDHTMSVEHVGAVRGLLEDARRSYDFRIYRDLPHGWLNDTMPGRFRAEAADETFSVMTDWLHRQLGAVDQRPAADETNWSFVSTIGTDYDFSTNERLH